MLEALRYGKAVVVTPQAEEGMPPPEHRAWITAETLPACADAVALLLKDSDARAELEVAAFAYGQRYIAFESFREQIRLLLPGAVARGLARLLV
jgi:hypothetical protein